MTTKLRKTDGRLEPYSVAKITRSLRRAGASRALAERIVASIPVERMRTTHDVHRYAFAQLRRLAPPTAARYNLKTALLRLGPSGYPFEKFVGEIFRSLGYTVRVNVVLPGRCIRHEVDVLAEDDARVLFMECKFHAQKSARSNVKVALYIKARFDDLAATLTARAKGRKVQGVIITNTMFSADAWRYTQCVPGLGLIAWRRPRGFSLAELIDRAGVHPVSAITSLSRRQKDVLMRRGTVLCRDVNRRTLAPLHLSQRKEARVIREAQAIRALRETLA